MVDPWIVYATAVATSIAWILWRYRHEPGARRVQLSVIAILALLTALALLQRW